MANVTGTYYPAEAFIGYGTELLVGQDNGSPETFVAIADVKTIQPGPMTTGVADVTHLRSPNRHREKLATIRDSGPFTIGGNWRLSHGSHSNAGGDGLDMGLIGLWRTVAERNFIIRLSDGSPETDWPFRGTVTNYTPGSLSLDVPVDFTAEITPLRDFSGDLP